MHRTRRLTVATLVAGGLLMAVAPAAHAVVDPITVIGCLTSSAADVGSLVDPSAPGLPTEIPATACLAP
jgi:hypothetical protein